MSQWITLDLKEERRKIRRELIAQLDDESRRELEALARGETEGYVEINLDEEIRRTKEEIRNTSGE